MSDDSSLRKYARDKKLSLRVAIVVAIIGGVCAICAACVGLGAPVIEWTLNTYTEFQVTATPSPPSYAVQLPGGESVALSVVAQPYHHDFVSLITRDTKWSVLTQTITAEFISDPGDLYAYFAQTNQLSTIRVTVVGKSTEEPVQISNSIPIKVISYESVPNETHFIGWPMGGGQDFWLVTVDLSDEVLSYPDQVAWATYTPDVRERFLSEQGYWAGQESEILPPEVQRAILSGTQPLPDYFLLEENETIGFSIAPYFRQPGVYSLQVGIEYLYKNYTAIEWTEPPMDVYVAKDYYIWSECLLTCPDPSTMFYRSSRWHLRSTGEYEYSGICTEESQGLKCE